MELENQNNHINIPARPDEQNCFEMGVLYTNDMFKSISAGQLTSLEALCFYKPMITLTRSMSYILSE